MTARFPFGLPATRRPARVPTDTADLFVLGVYPSALHVRWRRPDSTVIGALAVDDEPTVFWDGDDAGQRIERWSRTVGWDPAWGSLGMAGGNGSSGRVVVDDVLSPLEVAPERTYFTDCLPYYFVKSGRGSQGERIAKVYQPFAEATGLPPAELPARLSASALVRTAIAKEAAELRGQLTQSRAARVVTLGQEAADVLAAILDAPAIRLTPGTRYGTPRHARHDGRCLEWIPLTHPGNRTPIWRRCHQQWMINHGPQAGAPMTDALVADTNLRPNPLAPESL